MIKLGWNVPHKNFVILYNIFKWKGFSKRENFEAWPSKYYHQPQIDIVSYFRLHSNHSKYCNQVSCIKKDDRRSYRVKNCFNERIIDTAWKMLASYWKSSKLKFYDLRVNIFNVFKENHHFPRFHNRNSTDFKWIVCFS